MRRTLSRIWPLPLALLLLAASPAEPTDEWVRRGNAALARRDFAAALQSLDRAEERATDPGLVAFNKAVVFYQKLDFAQAEFHFRLALQDASGRRRAAARYDLAACLVQEANDHDVARLREAVALWEECLREDDLGEPFAGHARHNLELAKTLWVLAKARAEERKNDPPPNDENPNRPPPRPDDGKQGPADLGSGTPKGSGDKAPVKADPGDNPLADEQGKAGKGNLDAVPDQAELVPMTHEEAMSHLKQATERVLEERQAHRRRPPRAPAGKVRDW